MSLVLIIIINDFVIIIMTITIIVVVLCVKNVFLYIVIKKSCWTVTYSFESGLNFIYVGTVNGEGGYVFLKLDCFFTLNPSQMKINWRSEYSFLSLYLFTNHGATLLVRGYT